ncbi:hypothetical protein Sste5346_009872 [Sporothrix stenoceras]|uniref:NAD(P)-binding protein n=1 Tax=Sporothrix stenoceras TaxID=5173 RepID=A0ABR3YIX8_9PEZI
MFGAFPLAGKIVAVTGGASGIGLAFCKLALSSNARVIIADLKLNRDTEALVADNNKASFYKCDVRNWKELEDLVPFSESKFGNVPDVYAANAGIAESNSTGFWNDAEEDKYAALEVNLGHPIKLSRIAIRALSSRGKKGVVVITSSIAGMHGHFTTPLYSASKHGTIGLIKSMALAETEANVKVVGICPG